MCLSLKAVINWSKASWTVWVVLRRIPFKRLTVWLYDPESSQEIKITWEALIQGTENLRWWKTWEDNWPVRSPRDHLEKEAISTLRLEGQREMVQLEPRVTKGKWNHNEGGVSSIPHHLCFPIGWTQLINNWHTNTASRANSPKMQNKGRMSRQESKQTQDWTIGPRAMWCGLPNWTTALWDPKLNNSFMPLMIHTSTLFENVWNL